MIIIKHADHRKFPRRRFDALVRIEDHIRGRESIGSALDINPMGMLIETRKALCLGEIVTLSFQAPDGANIIRVSGEVIRIEGHGRGRQVGIEFFELEDWIFEELCGYVYDTDEPRPLVVQIQPRAAAV